MRFLILFTFVVVHLTVIAEDNNKFHYFFKKTDKTQLYKDIRAHYPDYHPLKEIMAKHGPDATAKLTDGLVQVVPIGPLQLWAFARSGYNYLTIHTVEKGGFGEQAGLLPWDEIHGIFDKIFSIEHKGKQSDSENGPVTLLGEGLEKAQYKGKIILNIIRKKVLMNEKGQTKTISKKLRIPVEIEKLTRLSSTYPVKCAKSDQFIKELTDLAINYSNRKRVSSSSAPLVGISLLSDGTPQIREAVENLLMHALPTEEKMEFGKSMRISEAQIKSSWVNGFLLMFLAEYFWATGDEAVFPLLQQLAYSVNDYHKNPYGAWAHAREGRGSYGTYTFGPTGGLMITAMAMAQKAGCKIPDNVYEDYYENLLLRKLSKGRLLTMKKGLKLRNKKEDLEKRVNFKVEPEMYYRVGYASSLSWKPEQDMGGSALTTVSALLALQSAPTIEYSKHLSQKLLYHLSETPWSHSYIHATPALGVLFNSLAANSYQTRKFYALASKNDKKSTETTGAGKKKLKNMFNPYYQNILNYRKYWITLSRFNKGRWQYMYPKNAMIGYKGMGGWGGDVYINLESCAIFQPLMMLTSSRKNLLIHGNKKRNWLNPEVDPKNTTAYIKKYHDFYAKHLFTKAVKLLNEKKIIEAYNIFNRIVEQYPECKISRVARKKVAYIRKRLGDKKFDFMSKEFEGRKFVSYFEKHTTMVEHIRTPLLYYVMDKFKGHPIEKNFLYLLNIPSANESDTSN